MRISKCRDPARVVSCCLMDFLISTHFGFGTIDGAAGTIASHARSP